MKSYELLTSFESGHRGIQISLWVRNLANIAITLISRDFRAEPDYFKKRPPQM